MTRILIAAFMLLSSMTSMAQTDYSSYYQDLPTTMPVPNLPTIPDYKVSLTDFGAVGDGITLNTEAFRKAISKLNKQGGGHLVVPAGIWKTGLISLKDNIDLHLEKNAIILFSPDKKDLIKLVEGKPSGEKASPCISASKRKNVSITGEGIIDGNGEWWRPVKRAKVSDVEWNQFQSMGGTVSEKGDLWYPFDLKHYDNIVDDKDAQARTRNHLVRFTDCENVLIQGVTLLNSPNFHLIPTRCNNVIIEGVTVKCPWNAQNGDAIDISSCRNVLIANNVVDAGDDGICMKAGAGAEGVEYGPCENINIQNNTVYHAHGGFVIGSEFSGGIKNVVVRNNKFCGTDTGLRFKSAIKRGGKTEKLYIDHIYMTDIKDQAIVFECTYANNQVGVKNQAASQTIEYVPDFQDIHISDIVVNGCETGITAHGAEGMVHDITVSDATIFYNKTAQDIDAACKITLNNVNFATFEK